MLCAVFLSALLRARPFMASRGGWSFGGSVTSIGQGRDGFMDQWQFWGQGMIPLSHSFLNVYLAGNMTKIRHYIER